MARHIYFQRQKKDPGKLNINRLWRLRDTDAEFQIWWKAQGKASIFFYGSSKRNLGRARASEVIYSADGKRAESFSWGVGQKTNNHVEMIGLLKSFQIACGKGIKDVQVFGDSKILIKTLNSDALFNETLLNKTLQRLKSLFHDFSSYLLFHILWGLNKEADAKENLRCLLSQGALKVNEDEAHWAPIPQIRGKQKGADSLQ